MGPSRHRLPPILGAALLAGYVLRRRQAIRAVAPELRKASLYLPTFLLPPVWAIPLWRHRDRSTALAAGVHVDRRVVRAEGHPVAVAVYDRPGRPGPSGAVLWIHGGGHLLGSVGGYHDLCSRFVLELGVLVVSVDYRLSPEHPFPADLDDCFAALRWLQQEAPSLGVDPGRIAVAGDSAGGGLAACLAQRAHDAGHPVAFQALVYPMLDDRTALRRDLRRRGWIGWTPRRNRIAWTLYLGRRPGTGPLPDHAAAARRTDLSGLPPAWIGVGDVDVFLAEDVAYAGRLRAAGVPCELHVEPGLYHGADAGSPDLRPAAAFRDRLVAALRSAVGAPTARGR